VAGATSRSGLVFGRLLRLCGGRRRRRRCGDRRGNRLRQHGGGRLKLPAGWKFRPVVLEQDLVLTRDNTGTAHITQDNFGNTYDRAGGDYSNFKP
jgi:hypothetical protein